MSKNIERLYFKSYLAMIHNSIGTAMYRNFYICTDNGQEVDAIGDGENACAFFVTSVLLIFGKQKRVHATVTSAIKDLEESGWTLVGKNDAKPGDVLVWAGRDDENGNQHIGFYVGENDAISTSSSQRKVTKHDMYYGQLRRDVTAVYRMENW